VFDNKQEILDDVLYQEIFGNNSDIINNYNYNLILLNKNNIINDINKDSFTDQRGDKSIDDNIATLYKFIVTKSSKNHKEIYDIENVNKNTKQTLKNIKDFKIHILLDSKPLRNQLVCFNLRAIAFKFRVNEYNKRTSISSNKSYKNYLDIDVRNFIKELLCTLFKYSEIASILKHYSLIIDFIKLYDPKYKINKSSLSKLKLRQIMFKQVPKTKETVLFVDYVKQRFPNFDETNFFK